jgi:hypothetical protein
MRPRTLTGVWGVFVLRATPYRNARRWVSHTFRAVFVRVGIFLDPAHPSHFVIKYRSCSSNPRLR